MKKKLFLMSLIMLFTCMAFAQDSIMNGTTKHRTTIHKKTLHNSSSTMPVDSVNAGKITTNPNGKMSSTKRKTAKSSMNSSGSSSRSKDSAR
jgi:hypothetical protein